MPLSHSPTHADPYVDVACTYCGPHRLNAANRRRKVMRVWRRPDGVESYYCARCGACGRVAEQPRRVAATTHSRTSAASAEQRTRLAQRLWRTAVPIGGTPAEHYLRSARFIGGGLPPTLRYLPANRKHPHAMIAAFGLVAEISCGELETPTAPPAVHLTRLAPDGLRRLDKIMIGPVSGHPIPLAPPNDGLGLVITEGIEDGLSLHEATGLGAWAAGSATHLAKLAPALPSYVSWITLAEDDDEAGRNAVRLLSDAPTARGFPVSVMTPARST